MKRQQITERQASKGMLFKMGFKYSGAVMSDQPSSPRNGVWYSNGDQRARMLQGELTIGTKAEFDKEYDDYVEFRQMFAGVVVRMQELQGEVA